MEVSREEGDRLLGRAAAVTALLPLPGRALALCVLFAERLGAFLKNNNNSFSVSSKRSWSAEQEPCSSAALSLPCISIWASVWLNLLFLFVPLEAAAGCSFLRLRDLSLSFFAMLFK